MLLADKAYAANAIRSQLHQQGVFANTLARAGHKEPVVFSPNLYAARNAIERFFNKFMFFRRIATRYDKLGSTFLAMIKRAAIRLYLDTYEATA